MSSPEDFSQGLQAILGGVVAGVLTWVASRRTERKSVNTPEHKEITAEPAPIPLPQGQSPEEVMQFMRLVQEDNASLRRELRDVKTDNQRLHSTLDEMARDIEADKDWKVKFMDALGRYLSKIAHEWGHSGSLPLPDGPDLITLQDIIPRS